MAEERHLSREGGRIHHLALQNQTHITTCVICVLGLCRAGLQVPCGAGGAHGRWDMDLLLVLTLAGSKLAHVRLSPLQSTPLIAV